MLDRYIPGNVYILFTMPSNRENPIFDLFEAATLPHLLAHNLALGRREIGMGRTTKSDTLSDSHLSEMRWDNETMTLHASLMFDPEHLAKMQQEGYHFGEDQDTIRGNLEVIYNSDLQPTLVRVIPSEGNEVPNYEHQYMYDETGKLLLITSKNNHYVEDESISPLFRSFTDVKLVETAKQLQIYYTENGGVVTVKAVPDHDSATTKVYADYYTPTKEKEVEILPNIDSTQAFMVFDYNSVQEPVKPSFQQPIETMWKDGYCLLEFPDSTLLALQVGSDYLVREVPIGKVLENRIYFDNPANIYRNEKFPRALDGETNLIYPNLATTVPAPTSTIEQPPEGGSGPLLRFRFSQTEILPTDHDISIDYHHYMPNHVSSISHHVFDPESSDILRSKARCLYKGPCQLDFMSVEIGQFRYSGSELSLHDEYERIVHNVIPMGENTLVLSLSANTKRPKMTDLPATEEISSLTETELHESNNQLENLFNHLPPVTVKNIKLYKADISTVHLIPCLTASGVEVVSASSAEQEQIRLADIFPEVDEDEGTTKLETGVYSVTIGGFTEFISVKFLGAKPLRTPGTDI